MSGQYGASHTSVTLYHTSKYGTGEGRHTRSRFNDSSPPNIFIRQETREQSGGGGAQGRNGEKRASRGRQARLRIPTRGPATAGPTDSGMPRGQLARNNNAAGKHICLGNSAQSDICKRVVYNLVLELIRSVLQVMGINKLSRIIALWKRVLRVTRDECVRFIAPKPTAAENDIVAGRRDRDSVEFVETRLLRCAVDDNRQLTKKTCVLRVKSQFKALARESECRSPSGERNLCVSSGLPGCKRVGEDSISDFSEPRSPRELLA
ncbi:hypothetical protein G5I_07282 [Acromyrmex echinatior]|uniref:Uncharacterized protein n=1 Tax=Acromyrmex echinatior TaxID=103372 RepID=F4WNC7_ACREC|nr:hypothetical protein G5I_07282 [Acromyrmex echinatior]